MAQEGPIRFCPDPQLHSSKMAKGMKAMKAMKVMKKKVSARTARRQVFAGLMDHTMSQAKLKKGDLIKNKRGKVVSKKNHARGWKNPWMVAVVAARKASDIKGLCMVKKGTPLYQKAKELMASK